MRQNDVLFAVGDDRGTTVTRNSKMWEFVKHLTVHFQEKKNLTKEIFRKPTFFGPITSNSNARGTRQGTSSDTVIFQRFNRISAFENKKKNKNERNTVHLSKLT